ncbi:MAG: ComF family protein [Candidatus Korobacteraceae bacterium]
MAKFAGALLGSMFAAVFPSDCRFCRAPLANLSRLPVCDQCLAKILPFDVPRCHHCGDPLAPDSEFLAVEICANCYIERPLFSCAISYGAYTDELRDLIHLLKYHQVRPASDVLGRMLAQAAEPLIAGFESQSILVIPVPLHASKFRERGFNQSELIARSAIRELGRQTGAGSAVKLELLTTALLRRRATESQVGMTRDQRRENIRGAFTVAGKEQVAGREVLLVDDVMTTGATVSECARMLLGAGVSAVFVATVARALNESSLFASSREGEGTVRMNARSC